MNYTTEEVNGKTIYNIENKKYVESEEATNFVKIDVNNYGIKTILVDNWYNKEYKGLRAKNFQEIYNIIRKWNNARW